jgi:RimJ/RimL family protein N-acetyltransferase
MIVLETKRVLLRHFVLTDLDPLFMFYSDPDVVKYIPDAPRTYQETAEELA